MTDPSTKSRGKLLEVSLCSPDGAVEAKAAVNSRSSLILGRKSELLPVRYPGVSKSHAEIVWDGSTVLLRNLGPKNGTRVGGQLIGSTATVEVRAGQRIQLGKYSGWVCVHPTEVAAQVPAPVYSSSASTTSANPEGSVAPMHALATGPPLQTAPTTTRAQNEYINGLLVPAADLASKALIDRRIPLVGGALLVPTDTADAAREMRIRERVSNADAPPGPSSRASAALCVSASPSGDAVALGYASGCISVFELRRTRYDGLPSAALEAEDADSKAVHSMAWACDGSRVYAATATPQALIVAVDRGGDGAGRVEGLSLETRTRKGDPYIRDVTQNWGHTGAVSAVCAHPSDRDRFATSSLDGSVRLWHVARGERRFKELLSGEEKGGDAKAFAERMGGTAVKRRRVTAASGSGGTGGKIRGCIRVRDPAGRPSPATALCWAMDSGRLLVGDCSGTLQAWDPEGALVQPAAVVPGLLALPETETAVGGSSAAAATAESETRGKDASADLQGVHLGIRCIRLRPGKSWAAALLVVLPGGRGCRIVLLDLRLAGRGLGGAVAQRKDATRGLSAYGTVDSLLPKPVVLAAEGVPCNPDGACMDWSPCGRYILLGTDGGSTGYSHLQAADRPIPSTGGHDQDVSPSVQAFEVAKALRHIRETRCRVLDWASCVVAERNLAAAAGSGLGYPSSAAASTTDDGPAPPPVNTFVTGVETVPRLQQVLVSGSDGFARLLFHPETSRPGSGALGVLARGGGREGEGVVLHGAAARPAADAATDAAIQAARSGRVYAPNALPLYRENKRDIRDRARGLSEAAIAVRREAGEEARRKRETDDLEGALEEARGTSSAPQTMWQHMMQEELKERTKRAVRIRKEEGLEPDTAEAGAGLSMKSLAGKKRQRDSDYDPDSTERDTTD